MDAYLRAGQPAGWLVSDVLFLEDAVSKLWVSSRTDPTDDTRFHVALHRWEAIATEAIATAAVVANSQPPGWAEGGWSHSWLPARASAAGL